MSQRSSIRSPSLLLLLVCLEMLTAGCSSPTETDLATAQALAETKVIQTRIAGEPPLTKTPTATEASIPTDTPQPSSTPLPTPMGGGGYLLFTSDQDGNYEIYRMNSDGTEPTRLTQNYVSDREPAMSQDGEQIAFVSAYGGAGLGIVVMDSNGENPVHRMTFPKGIGGSPSWGPGGQLLFWAHACVTWCNHPKYNAKFRSVMYFMDSDGTDLEMVKPPSLEGAPLDTDWSPDGEKVVIVDGPIDLAIVTLVGTMIDENPDRYVNCRHPSWSPDGSKIAFVSSNEGNDEIFVFDIQRDRVARITNNPAADRSPTWSPDGQWLVYTSNRDGNWNLYFIRSNGKDEYRLSDSRANEVDPSWYR